MGERLVGSSTQIGSDILSIGGGPAENLAKAAHAVSTAVLLLKMEMPTIAAFLKEDRDMENFGHILDPTLYRDPTRRAVNALVKPLFEAATAFVRAHDEQVERSKAALAKVQGR